MKEEAYALMLTIRHPELLQHVRDLPAGLLPLSSKALDHPVLVIKGMKEALLAARLNRGFKVYVAPIALEGRRCIGLITAFFDDPDEPLIVRSPLYGEDEHSRMLLQVLCAPEIDVHFFDEHARELLAYRCAVAMPEATHKAIEAAEFVEFSFESWPGVDDQLQHWFSYRSKQDDQAAIDVRFIETRMPEDVAYIDGTPENTSFVGSNPVITSQLVRDEPGAMQEHDIALLLQRIFSPAQIIKSPLRDYDREEIADLVVVTATSLFFIQAKDSPNTEGVLRNSLQRKRATALKSLNKALRQLRGAVGYARRSEPMAFLLRDKRFEVSISGLQWYCIAVVKELFNDEYASYSPIVLEVSEGTGVPCVALDYAELNMYTANLADESSFLAAIERVLTVASQTGMLPRLRIASPRNP